MNKIITVFIALISITAICIPQGNEISQKTEPPQTVEISIIRLLNLGLDWNGRSIATSGFLGIEDDGALCLSYSNELHGVRGNMVDKIWLLGDTVQKMKDMKSPSLSASGLLGQYVYAEGKLAISEAKGASGSSFIHLRINDAKISFPDAAVKSVEIRRVEGFK